MKVLVLGTYSAEALAGMVGNPSDDRTAAVTAMMEATGMKMHSMDFLRGEYDFAVIGEGDSFEDVAAIKMLVMASGALSSMKILEMVDINAIAEKASAVSSAYRKPGQ